MSFKVVTTPDTDADLVEICNWYAQQSIGLDLVFLDTLRAMTEQMAALPKSFPIVYKETHMALLNQFPYKVLFVIDEEEKQVIILAVVHTARHPRAWRLEAANLIFATVPYTLRRLLPFQR